MRRTAAAILMVFIGTSLRAQPPAAAPAKQISFEEASRGLSGVFPVRLDRMAQVDQNSYNWSGVADASLRCDIGFAPQALVLRGEFRDDHPFVQTRIHPARPDYWRIQYGADGIEYILDDPTSATRSIRLALNYGSGAVNPQVELLSTFTDNKPGFIPTASFVLQDPDHDAPMGTVQFQAAIPYDTLAPADFFQKPLRITVRLHDLDGDTATYQMMQEIIEKR